MECPTNTSVILDNTPLDCDELISTQCVFNSAAITFLNLPVNSSQKAINDAIVLTLITAFNRITDLENRITILESPTE